MRSPSAFSMIKDVIMRKMDQNPKQGWRQALSIKSVIKNKEGGLGASAQAEAIGCSDQFVGVIRRGVPMPIGVLSH